jgi:hypothetical protein
LLLSAKHLFLAAKAGPRIPANWGWLAGGIILGSLGLEGIVSTRLGSRYTSGRSRDWLKFKNLTAPAVRRQAEEDWG